MTIETGDTARSPEPLLVAAGTTRAAVRAGVDADSAAVEAGRVTVEAAAAAVVVAAAVVASAVDATCVAPPLAAGGAVPTVLVGGAAADGRPGDGACTACVTAPSVEASSPAARADERSRGRGRRTPRARCPRAHSHPDARAISSVVRCICRVACSRMSRRAQFEDLSLPVESSSSPPGSVIGHQTRWKLRVFGSRATRGDAAVEAAIGRRLTVAFPGSRDGSDAARCGAVDPAADRPSSGAPAAIRNREAKVERRAEGAVAARSAATPRSRWPPGSWSRASTRRKRWHATSAPSTRAPPARASSCSTRRRGSSRVEQSEHAQISRARAGSSTTRGRSGRRTREVIAGALAKAGRERRGRRRRRHHQPARDHRASGTARRGEPIAQRDRLAGHAHRPAACASSPATPAGPAARGRGLPLATYFSGPKLALAARPRRRARASAPSAASSPFGTIDTWLLWNLTGGRAARDRRDQRLAHDADGPRARCDWDERAARR